MKQEVILQEVKLIRKWKKEHDENIALYFFNKYKDDILNIIYKKINIKFSSIPLEKDDFFYVVWKSVLDLLKEYKLTKKGNFKDLLIRKAYLSSIKEAIKFLKNDQLVLNTAVSSDYLKSLNKNFNFGKNNKTNIDTNYDLARKTFIEKIITFNQKYPIDFLKRVIYLKSLGYTVKEISEKINMPTRKVQHVVNYICDITKKLYY